MYNIGDIAKYYLAKVSMAPRKIHGIVYYAYVWYLTMQNESADNLEYKLFNENLEAWIHGPRNGELYDRYKNGQMIDKYTDVLPEFDEVTLDILEQIWDVYGEYDSYELDSICRQEAPWQLARKRQQSSNDYKKVVIDDKEIFTYYVARLKDEEKEVD